jgi:hypothetical protein
VHAGESKFFHGRVGGILDCGGKRSAAAFARPKDFRLKACSFSWGAGRGGDSRIIPAFIQRANEISFAHAENFNQRISGTR